MRIWLLLVGAIALDQWTKHLIRMSLAVGQSISVIGDVVRITYVENPGIIFGILVRSPLFYMILSIAASIGIAVYLYRHRKDGFGFTGSLTLFLSGAIGNLIDRILFQKVVDFIDIGVKDVRWPVFNVADSAVVIGMFWLFFHSMKKEHHASPAIESSLDHS